MRYVLPLSAIRIGHAGRVGRKAAVLGELRAAGFAVPDGFAVTVDAFDQATGAACTAEPAGLADELRGALAALEHSGPVAVRSSGLSEDLAGMSYAGQYESVLGVCGRDAVMAAIRACWASASTARVAAYANAGGPVRMGVLVQVMVDPAVAGVAFSSNPVTGDRAEAVVSATDGLGDRLAAGQVDAEEWTVRGDTARLTPTRSATAAVLGVDQARAVAELARSVAERLAAPQDVEWAFGPGGELWLLQARPITALPDPPVEPVPVEIEVPPGFSTRNQSMDRPWTPLERSVFLPVFSAAVRHIFRYTTRIEPTAHSIGGWIYINVPADAGDGRAARLRQVAADLERRRPQELIQRWHETWRSGLADQIAELREVDLAGLTDAALEAHIRALVRFFGLLHDRYFRLTGAAIAIGGHLNATCSELLGWSEQQVGRLRGGLAGAHMTATVRLSELAALAAGRPAVRRVLDRPDAEPERLAGADADFAAAFADYVRRYAHRTVGFDLTEPTLAEQPRVLLSLIRARIARPYDFAAERAAVEARIAGALGEARAALAGRPAADRARFESAFAAAALSAPVRDEKAFLAVSTWALLRYGALELGRRLVDRRAADRAEDAFFLELPAALTALSGGGDQRDRIRVNRGRHAWALANPGPPTYGPSAAQPPGGPGPEVPSADDGELRGLAASPGRYVGPVRVVRDVTEFGKLRDGDVLVCPETTAQWSMLFPCVGALVTDRGSLLSHPAIIAREYGVPAVVATGSATSVLRDDEFVVVDGAAGVVRPAPETVGRR